MSEKPILFSGPMVRAILAGTKTQTRRIVKDADYYSCLTGDCPHDTQSECDASMLEFCPYGKPGDKLWVRETWAYYGGDEHLYQREQGCCMYRATWDDDPRRPLHHGNSPLGDSKWRSSQCMPRWASRLTLLVKSVRVERLQGITEADAIAEGVDSVSIADVPRQAVWTRRQDFAQLWEKINGRGSWDANCWVWVVEFEREDA